jgi:hypothetical protein
VPIDQFGQGSSAALDELLDPMPLDELPLALPDMLEPAVLEVPLPVVALPAAPGPAAVFSRGCCVARSRQCVAGETLALGLALGELPDGEDDEPCAAAMAILPPTNAVASSKVFRDRIGDSLECSPAARKLRRARRNASPLFLRVPGTFGFLNVASGT